jgi:ribonuclease HI
MKLKITVDGSCARKRMFVGIIIRDAANGKILCLEHRYLGFGTNNQAEYLAIILACRTAVELYQKQVEEVSIFTDSQLVFNQLRGAYAVRNKKLRDLHRRAVNWMRHRIRVPVHVSWHSREDDDGPLADKLASAKFKEVMDESDHRVVKRGAGKNDPRKARRSGVRSSRRESDSVETQTSVAHHRASGANGANGDHVAHGKTTRIGSTPRRTSA